MNQRQHKLLPTVAFLVTAALATSAHAAQVDCTKPSGHEQLRACKAAMKAANPSSGERKACGGTGRGA